MEKAPPNPLPKPPDGAALYEAALAHLARYAATQAGLLQVLERRIARWVRLGGDETVAEQARVAARGVVEKLAAIGAVDDAAFAKSRARSLTRAGRSRRAVTAHLRAKGIDEAVAQASLPEDVEAEFAAALAYTKKRRIGAFRRGEADIDQRRRELAALARAGFSQDVARKALAAEPDAAEAVVIKLRQG